MEGAWGSEGARSQDPNAPPPGGSKLLAERHGPEVSV